MTALPEKKCFKCGEVKTLSDFYKHSSTKDGYTGACKSCTRAKSNAWRQANLDAVREYDKVRRKKCNVTSDEWEMLLKRNRKENQSETQWAVRLARGRKENITEAVWSSTREKVRTYSIKENMSVDEWADKTEYAKLYRYNHRENIRESCRQWQSKNAKKVKVHRLMWSAIKAGTLAQGQCEVCGADVVHGHHPDYDKPLKVMWLCPEHHHAWHREHGEGLNAHYLEEHDAISI